MNIGRIDPKNWRDYPDHYTNSLWPNELPHRPRDYGNNGFHGRTHPEIVFVALERYTKPGDIVYDPFAGSGTTIDVCKELENRCIACDIVPVRDDIKQADARYFIPDVEEIHHAIIHPPYLDIIHYSDEGGLCTNDLEEWISSMYKVIGHVYKLLKPGHVMTFIVGSVYIKNYICLDLEILNILRDMQHADFNGKLLGRITRGFGETKGGKSSGAKNENLWKYRRLKDGYWSLGVDNVLFWQKSY